MRNNQNPALLEKMQALAQSYVPEWKFSIDNPDPGSVVALLCCDMLEESRSRFDRVLHKHKIQYMNLFDRFKEEPVEAARTYVRFNPVTGVDAPIPVPKGTRLLAENEDVEHIVFETTHSMTVTSAQLASVMAANSQKDCIVKLMEKDENPEHACFRAFDLTRPNCSEHILLLGWDDALQYRQDLDLYLHITGVSDAAAAEAAQTLGSDKVQLAMREPQGNVPFDEVEVQGSTLHLVKYDYTPQRTPLNGKDRFVLEIAAKQLCDVQLTGLTLTFSGQDIAPEKVLCAGVQQNPEHFLPFGKPMEIYAECGIECQQLFSRPGASARMSFSLGFETLEQLLPEYETETKFRLIMRQPRPMPKPVIMDVNADYVLIEYLSTSGWKRMIQEENVALLFNGMAQNQLHVKFTVPDDMVSAEDNPGEYRMRMRLMQAENLYRLPVVQHCPVIDHLRFAYTYADSPLHPDCALIRNNFREEDLTQRLRDCRTANLFYTQESPRTAMYLGFDKPFTGSPVSLYFEIENNEDYPVDFLVEYAGPDGFVPLKVVDQTTGFLYSGSLLMMIPKDICKTKRFGQELYWIRLVRRDTPDPDAGLPLVKGIYTNLAQVENHRTMVETFYVDDIDAAVDIQLTQRELIHAQVYVNEAGRPDAEENWVKWEKSTGSMDQGRSYEIDLAAGQIRFRKNIFSVYPIRDDGPAIKVEYQSYQGAQANVPAGAIHTMSESLRFINSATNPIAAYGGYDSYNESTAAKIISNMMRTRGRAVTERDYFDLISQVTYGVRRIKCQNGIDQYGRAQPDAITIAILIDEYEKGSHIFSTVKDQIRKKLMESSSILPMGKTLILSQPYFVRMSMRIWLECDCADQAYELQKDTETLIRQFIDPLHGGFEGTGWEIGTLPTVQQILAYLKIRLPAAAVTRTALTASFGRSEHAVNDEIYQSIHNPFAMAVNGDHVVYVDLKE